MILNSEILRQVVRLLRCVYTPLALICIVIVIVKNRVLLGDLCVRADKLYISVSVLLWAFLHLLSPISTLLILKSYGYQLGYIKVLKIYLSRLPARYLPGGVWHTIGRLADFHQNGVSKRHLTQLATFEIVFPIPLTIFVGGSMMYLSSLIGKDIQLPTLVLPLLLVCLILLLLPLYIIKFTNTKRDLHYKSANYYLLFLMVGSFFWFVAAGSFILYFYSFSITGSYDQSVLTVAGAYVFAWGAGYISFFAPQGIGVFEFVAGKIIDLPMSLGSSIAFLAGFRLVALAADITVYCVFQLIYRSWRNR